MKKLCAAEACYSFVAKRGLCARHGGRDKCTVDGCSIFAVKHGVCLKHVGVGSPESGIGSGDDVGEETGPNEFGGEANAI